MSIRFVKNMHYLDELTTRNSTKSQMLEPLKSVLGKGSSASFDFTYSVWWNLFLISAEASICAVAVKSFAVPHEFLAGGIFGLASLIFYTYDVLSPGWLYSLLKPNHV
jgi:hypothetical protein